MLDSWIDCFHVSGINTTQPKRALSPNNRNRCVKRLHFVNDHRFRKYLHLAKHNFLRYVLETSFLTECEYTGAHCSNESAVPDSGSCQAMQRKPRQTAE